MGGEGALANAWSTYNPEETRGPVGGVPPIFNRLKQPRPPDQCFLKQLSDARIGRKIGNRRLEQFFERFDFAGKAPALVALHDRDNFHEFGLIPTLSHRLARGASFF